ncbi:hypothetical protein GCM10027262_57740 [Nocardia tengchongensis]
MQDGGSGDPEPGYREIRRILDRLAEHGVEGDIVRVVDYDVRPGVSTRTESVHT